jgi:hypothetical protein
LNGLPDVLLPAILSHHVVSVIELAISWFTVTYWSQNSQGVSLSCLKDFGIDIGMIALSEKLSLRNIRQQSKEAMSLRYSDMIGSAWGIEVTITCRIMISILWTLKEIFIEGWFWREAATCLPV